MITITSLDTICKELTAELPEVTGGHVLVVSQKNAVNRMKDKNGVILVAAVPSASNTGSLGSSRSISAVIFYILEKDLAHGDEIEQLGRLQPTILSLQLQLLERAENGCSIFSRLEPAQLNIEPVYKEFGSFNGWELTAVF